MEVAGIPRKWFARTLVLAVALSLCTVSDAMAAGALISIDSSLLIQIVNFLFLIWALNVILYKPIRGILLKRKTYVTDLEEGVEQADGAAKEKGTAFEEGIRAARNEGVEKKKAMMEEAAQEEMAIVEKINSKAQADLAEVKAKITEEADSVRESLQAEIDTFAGAIGQKILGRAI